MQMIHLAQGNNLHIAPRLRAVNFKSRGASHMEDAICILPQPVAKPGRKYFRSRPDHAGIDDGFGVKQTFQQIAITTISSAAIAVDEIAKRFFDLKLTNDAVIVLHNRPPAPRYSTHASPRREYSIRPAVRDSASKYSERPSPCILPQVKCVIACPRYTVSSPSLRWRSGA